MLKKILYLFIVVYCFNHPFLVAQQGIPLGQWRDHLPYDNCIAVADGNDRIYCATKYSLFYYNKLDYSITRLSKVEGLSDNNINTINYNLKYNTLLIAYSNCNIDLLVNDQIINISDIKRKNILGEKIINNIYFIDKYAYLSCGFGIIVLDILKKEIKDTYFIGTNGSTINVLDLTTDTKNLYAATEKGIFKASLNNPNISNFTAWEKDVRISCPDCKYNLIEYFNNNLFVNKSGSIFNTDTVFVFNGTSWKCFDSTRVGATKKIKFYSNILIIAYEYGIYGYDSSLTKTINVWSYNPRDYTQPGSSLWVNDAIISKEGMIWIADNKEALIKSKNFIDYEKIRLNGPFHVNVFMMASVDDKLWVASGARNDSWGLLWTKNGVYSFIDEKWVSYNYTNTQAFDSIIDILSVAVDPLNSNKVYAGSYWNGLIEFNNGILTNVYTGYNSPIGSYEFDHKKFLVSGIGFDMEENLWVAVSYTDNLIVEKKNDGTWKSYNIGKIDFPLFNLIVDAYNRKWMIMGRGGGILVFDEKNPSNNKTKILTSNSGSGGLPSNGVYSMVQDAENKIWVGTDKGIAVFYNPENVFSNEKFDAQQILVERDGYAQYLLENEVVTAIAVDGSNKKWIGTQNAGVFLLSADGTQQLLHFTQDNSPLFSNIITSIAINGSSGEVFIGTPNGIISYRGNETKPNSDYSNVYAFPNPVRENYNGLIAVKGLMANTDVKITDISGSLVFATKAEGGQAIWNGRNMNGKKVHSGVYLVFCSTADGKDTQVTKILVLN